MTPKEKAEELIEKFDELLTYRESKTKTKQCALIAVDTVLFMASHYATIEYWKEVKQEIEAL